MSSPVLITPCPSILACVQLHALVIKSKVSVCFPPLPVNGFPYKLAPNEPNVPNDNMLRNSPFCAFPSFSIVLLMPFVNKPYSSRDLTIFMISSISSFKIINVVCFAKSTERMPKRKILF